MRFEAVIFDMDGTLLDSMDVYNPLFVELTVTNIIGQKRKAGGTDRLSVLLAFFSALWHKNSIYRASVSSCQSRGGGK